MCFVLANLGMHLLCQQEQLENGGHDLHLYLLAQYKAAEGSLKDAGKYYEQLMSNPSTPIAAYKGYTQFLILNNQYQKILDLAPKLDKTFSEDPAVQMAIIEALDHTHNHKESIDRLINLSQKNKTNAEIAFKAAQVYLTQHEPENAIHVIDSFLENESQKPNLFMFHFFKAQILIQLDKKQEALTAIKQCLKTHTHFDKGWLLYAVLEEQLGNLQGAIKGFSTFLDLTGADNAIQQHIVQLMFKQKMLTEKTNSLNVSIPCLKRAMILFEQRKTKAALEAIEECLKKTPQDSQARLLKIQILSALNQQGTILACLTDWIKQEPSKELWFKTLLLMTNKGVLFSDAINTLKNIEKQDPKEILPIQYLADLYLRTEQPKLAIQYLNKLITTSKDNLLSAKAYYQIACIHYEERDFDAMKFAATKGLALAPNFAPLCNILAYYYAGKGHDIPQAQQLIAIALKKDPKNPHYLDTQSHIYYKNHDYKQASKIIEILAQDLPDDPHIIKHAKKIGLAIAEKK